jgi:putative nucleotidyltransferase with HDIG domain
LKNLPKVLEETLEDSMLAPSFELEPSGLDRFAIDRLVDNSVTDFDLYLKVNRHFILYGGAGYKWSRDELTQLLRNGYSHFFVMMADMSKAQMYEQMSRLPQIEKNLAPPERIKHIEDVGHHFTKCLYAGEITPSAVATAERISQAMVDCIQEDRGCVKNLTGLSDHDAYTYYHSVRVSAFAVALASQMGMSSAADLNQVAIGGLFHDVGKKNVPLDLINKTGPLTDAEWALMRAHPQSGLLLIKDSVLSMVSREIVVHHHERLNGTGYPDGLSKGSLLPEVQIATVADIFDALTSSRNYQRRRTRYEALDFMKHKLLGTEISLDVFKALVQCLAT